MNSQFISDSAAKGAEFLDQKVLNKIYKPNTSSTDQDHRDINPAPTLRLPSTKPGVGHEWSEPQPLTAKIEPEPYPIESLPACNGQLKLETFLGSFSIKHTFKLQRRLVA